MQGYDQWTKHKDKQTKIETKQNKTKTKQKQLDIGLLIKKNKNKITQCKTIIHWNDYQRMQIVWL